MNTNATANGCRTRPNPSATDRDGERLPRRRDRRQIGRGTGAPVALTVATAHRNGTGRGDRSGRARTCRRHGNATAGGCGAFGANLSALPCCRDRRKIGTPRTCRRLPVALTVPTLSPSAAWWRTVAPVGRSGRRTRRPVAVGRSPRRTRRPVAVGRSPRRTRDRRRHGGSGTRETGRGEPLPVPVRTRDRPRTCHPPEPVALLPSAYRTRGGCRLLPVALSEDRHGEPVTVGTVATANGCGRLSPRLPNLSA